jgi:nitrate/TMAO reductase-like tetraheme cytochrome c subunit
VPWKFLGIGFGLLVVSWAGWLVSDRLEADNDFCNACHLRPGVPLHDQIRRNFDARPAPNLAGLHAAAEAPVTATRTLSRCIDCHGGVGLEGRARVKVLAAKDAFFWLIDHFDEPEDMAVPLRDADCMQCHARFAGEAFTGESGGPEPFHSFPVHNSELGVDCVECHTVHDGGADPSLFFLDARHVRTICGRCHSEFRDR